MNLKFRYINDRWERYCTGCDQEAKHPVTCNASTCKCDADPKTHKRLCGCSTWDYDAIERSFALFTKGNLAEVTA